MITNSLTASKNVLDVLSMKQELISENLANMHTPGYKRRDVNFSQYLSGHNNKLETDLSEKLGPSPFNVTASGEVSATDELMDMQKIQVFYSVAARQMTSVIQQMKQVTQAGK